MRVFTVLIHCIVIYAVNSAIQLLNKRGQVTEVFSLSMSLYLLAY